MTDEWAVADESPSISAGVPSDASDASLCATGPGVASTAPGPSADEPPFIPLRSIMLPPEIAQGECALCGVVLELGAKENVVLILSDNACAVFHSWCWEQFEPRILGLSRRGADQSKDDATSDTSTDDAAAS